MDFALNQLKLAFKERYVAKRLNKTEKLERKYITLLKIQTGNAAPTIEAIKTMLDQMFANMKHGDGDDAKIEEVFKETMKELMSEEVRDQVMMISARVELAALERELISQEMPLQERISAKI